MKPATTLLILSPLLMGAQSSCMFGAPETTVVDTFCLTEKKRIWSIDDTAETIRAAEVRNSTIDRRCGVPKG